MDKKHEIPQYRQDRLEYIDTLEYLDDMLSGLGCGCTTDRDGAPVDCDVCQMIELIREQLDWWKDD